MTSFPLGWRPPEDRSHEVRYALSTAMPDVPAPVVMGVPWYSSFDVPRRDEDGYFWIGGKGPWGNVRGGHCVCLRPPAIPDLVGAQIHWNQRSEGACVGFGVSRAASLYNRVLYDGFSLYYAAQKRDGFPDSSPGTSVNAGLETLRVEGAWRNTPRGVRPFLKDGCISYLWARSAEDVMRALKSEEDFVRILNSWGTSYPAEVRIAVDDIERLLAEGGEFGVPVDRPGRSRRSDRG